ncbi:hypothetical protein CRG98_024314 [Punica granatum]|uniref:Uncharacterized protein n=1 Tax=Punica granatum TaxID=22663 RepID=A0A2I0JGD7_PUNGR|nr:hypothetical protein CRG98_024314 [Punica granatum]
MNAGNPLFFQTQENAGGEGEMNKIWDDDGVWDGGEQDRLNLSGLISEERIRARNVMGSPRLNGCNGLGEQGEESPLSSGPSELNEQAARDVMSSPQPSNLNGPSTSSPNHVQNYQPEGQLNSVAGI